MKAAPPPVKEIDKGRQRRCRTVAVRAVKGGAGEEAVKERRDAIGCGHGWPTNLQRPTL